MREQWATERSVARLVIAGAALLFLTLVMLGGAFFESFDEAKYLGLGRNLFAGHTFTTVFGVSFLTHAPGWPFILVAPDAWFGVDALAWGRLVNAASGAGLIAMTGYLGWRIRPAAGGLAAAALLGVPYLADLSRTARLDVPAASVSVLAMIVGVAAIQRGSVRRAIASGALFALAFLLKETSLVLVAVPTLAGIVSGQRGSTIARISAWIGLVMVAGIGWWFVVVAIQSGLVYRTSLPAWTLVPGGIALGLAAVAGLAAERIAHRVGHRVPHVDRGGRVGWGLLASVTWSGLMLLVLARSPELGTSPLISGTQIVSWARAWGSTLRYPFVFIGVGSVAVAVAMAAAWRARRASPSSPLVATGGGSPATATAAMSGPDPVADVATALPDNTLDPFRTAQELAPAIIASLPLALFVVATGEPPRNDFAPLAFAFAFAAAGWIVVARWLWTTERTIPAVVTGAAIGTAGGFAASAIDGVPPYLVASAAGALAGAGWALVPWFARRSAAGTGTGAAGRTARRTSAGLLRFGVPIVLAGSLVVAAGGLALHVRRAPGTATSWPRALAVRQITTWVRANVPAGSTIAVGSLLGNETAIELPDYRTVKVSAVQAMVTADAPLGIALRAGDRTVDWLALDPHPRKTDRFYAFTASAVVGALQRSRPVVWIYVIGESTAAPSIIGALTPDHGFTAAAHWTWGSNSPPLEGWAFTIDQSTLGFASAPIRFSPAALQRLVTLLKTEPMGPSTARALLPRVAVSPAGDAERQAMAALQALASGP